MSRYYDWRQLVLPRRRDVKILRLEGIGPELAIPATRRGAEGTHRFPPGKQEDILAAMEVMFKWSREDRIVSLTYEGAVINSDAAYEEWTTKLFAGFERSLRLAGGKYGLVVCIDELIIKPEFRSRYGQVLAVKVAEKYATCIARYGTRRVTRAVVATEAMKRVINHTGPEDTLGPEYDANVFDTREQAVAHVRALMATG